MIDSEEQFKKYLETQQEYTKPLRIAEYAKYALSGCIVSDALAKGTYSRQRIVREAFMLAEAFEEERARREGL